MNVTKLFPSGGYEVSDMVGDQLVRHVYLGYTKTEAVVQFRRHVWDESIIYEQDKTNATHCPKCGARSDLIQGGRRVSVERCPRCVYYFQVIFK